MLAEAAHWIAPAATMIAAMMTAANLGSRLTGWGFVVFAIGAVGWIIDGIVTGQHDLLLTNGFLLIVDLVGVWRWLGLRARYDRGAEAAEQRSGGDVPQLVQLSTLAGKPVRTQRGETIAKAVDAMIGCRDGAVAYLVVSRGGIGGAGETLHALGWQDVTVESDAIVAGIDATKLAERPTLDPARWPATAEAAGAA